MAEVLAIFINTDTRIKGTQKRGHESKKKILLMTPLFCLRDIICLTRIQVILKLQKASSSKKNFSKNQILQDGSCKKKELIKQDK